MKPRLPYLAAFVLARVVAGCSAPPEARSDDVSSAQQHYERTFHVGRDVSWSAPVPWEGYVFETYVREDDAREATENLPARPAERIARVSLAPLGAQASGAERERARVDLELGIDLPSIPAAKEDPRGGLPLYADVASADYRFRLRVGPRDFVFEKNGEPAFVVEDYLATTPAPSPEIPLDTLAPAAAWSSLAFALRTVGAGALVQPEIFETGAIPWFVRGLNSTIDPASGIAARTGDPVPVAPTWWWDGMAPTACHTFADALVVIGNGLRVEEGGAPPRLKWAPECTEVTKAPYTRLAEYRCAGNGRAPTVGPPECRVD